MGYMKTIIIVLTVIIVILLGAILFVQFAKGPTMPSPTSRPAVSTDGTFTVSAPIMNTAIVSPVAIAGQAMGWYFEAVFPVKILDGDGTVLGEGQAQAQSDWMTTSSVPFLAIISFTIGSSSFKPTKTTLALHSAIRSSATCAKNMSSSAPTATHYAPSSCTGNAFLQSRSFTESSQPASP